MAGECATVCPAKAITLVFGDGDVLGFTERLAEYALAAVKDKPGRVGYINFVLNVTPDCDWCSLGLMRRSCLTSAF